MVRCSPASYNYTLPILSLVVDCHNVRELTVRTLLGRRRCYPGRLPSISAAQPTRAEGSAEPRELATHHPRIAMIHPRRPHVISLFLLSSLLLTSSYALPYFRLEEGSRQCFIEEGPLLPSKQPHRPDLAAVTAGRASLWLSSLSVMHSPSVSLMFVCAVPEDTLIVGKYKTPRLGA